MERERLARIETLYHHALELEGDRRRSFLDNACAGDEDLRREVESLLGYQNPTGNLIERPIQKMAAKMVGVDKDRLAIGGQINHYQILSPLGAGGMGEVYRGRDTKLSREVAIKVLPEEFSRDKERQARFEREARLLAALNHPNVAAIHGLEESDGMQFLVLELVEGETLADRIARGPIPVKEALETCRQIAEGLEAAHGKGVIHRDLKPANIKVTPEGKVKVLDFGLAKAFASDPSEIEIANSPTITQDSKNEGVILGTAPYMSPEQARGKNVDKRSDVWAFGCVLFECLVGKRPFEGETVTDILSAIVDKEPDWNRLPATTPPLIRSLLGRCLQKDPVRRVHDIADARVEIEEVQENPEGLFTGSESVVAPMTWRRMLPWALATLVLTIVTGIVVWNLKSPVTTSGPLLFEEPVPDGEVLSHFYRQGVALSPDGTHLAFVSGMHERGPNPRRSKIYLRQLDQLPARPMPGTENASQLFFSPDGNWLGFYVNTGPWLMKVNLTGGDPEEICECNAGMGAVWGPDNWIIFGLDHFGSGSRGLYRVPASGGEPQVITKPDLASGEGTHILPHVLPGGKVVLYTYVTSFDQWAWPHARIFAEHLETGERKPLIEGASDARYVSTGHLIFARRGQLKAVPFDVERLAVTGTEVTVINGVNHSISTGYAGNETGAAQFSFSSTGTLAYVPGSVFPETSTMFVSVDRQGREEPLPLPPKFYSNARVSSDGRQVLLGTGYAPSDIWLYNLDRGGTPQRQTFGGNAVFAIWGPGPDSFTYSAWGEPTGIYVKKINTGPDEAAEKLPIEAEELHYRETAISWSLDGDLLLVDGDGHVWIWTREGKTKPLLETKFTTYWPEFSPDGHWIVYGSDESGQMEIYVRPYPGPGPNTKISTNGGRGPAWSRDGSEIFYKYHAGKASGGKSKLLAVRIEVSPEGLTGSKPVELFERYMDSLMPIRGRDVSPDGRFLIGMMDSSSAIAAYERHFPTRIQVVQHWFEELQSLVPSGGPAQ